MNEKNLNVAELFKHGILNIHYFVDGDIACKYFLTAVNSELIAIRHNKRPAVYVINTQDTTKTKETKKKETTKKTVTIENDFDKIAEEVFEEELGYVYNSFQPVQESTATVSTEDCYEKETTKVTPNEDQQESTVSAKATTGQTIQEAFTATATKESTTEQETTMVNEPTTKPLANNL